MFMVQAWTGRGGFYIWSATDSTNFRHNPLQSIFQLNASFLSVLHAMIRNPVCSSRLTFSEWAAVQRLNPTGPVYITGYTSTTNLWVTNAFQPTLSANTNGHL